MIRLWRADNGLAPVSLLECKRVPTKVRPKTSVFAGGGTLGRSVLSMVSFPGCKGQGEQYMMR